MRSVQEAFGVTVMLAAGLAACGVDGSEAPACASGAACDDGDPCTDRDRCDDRGSCTGSQRSCDDGLACTIDLCDPAPPGGACVSVATGDFCVLDGACVPTDAGPVAGGCARCVSGDAGPTLTVTADGAPCDDGDACTNGDACRAGACEGGPPRACPDTDPDPCLGQVCDPVSGCLPTPVASPCDDGNACTVSDTCLDGVCASAERLACDDGDPCTTDACEPDLGCRSRPACDDGRVCTEDRCDPATGACTNALLTGPCDDGDPCTDGETCDASGACNGATPVDCDDDNACTVERCDPARGGCVTRMLMPVCDGLACQPAACDDGLACTLEDQCVAGVCFGGKTTACDLCELKAFDAANKIIRLSVPPDGALGSGLDVDEDPATCAPADSCSGGVDNALGPLAPILGDSVQAALDDGLVMWVIDYAGWNRSETPFTLRLFEAELASHSYLCDFTGGPNAPESVTEICDYHVSQVSLDARCDPYFELPGARVMNDKIIAGGLDAVIRMALPLAGGSLLGLTVAAARFEGNLRFAQSGRIAAIDGVLGGAIPKAQLMQALLSLRPSDLGGIDPASVVPLLDALVTNDIDLDHDGEPESVSLALKVQTIPARVVLPPTP
jgi:hypothetical protein